ncbi:ThuA domain-containing protein [Paenibacillus dokdonensis]|uniref:ThuA domain-containing protein n=1 Tax=Paenibacillus dokdonensis TaxID=2567944 RepID=A0ABU6GI31_9BACL|nr:ThuA domain-containing protein [Paenibacillus dokdonensis]MEC0239387.1 ThuA domain-containing protein [Paenibacillus dokdonensis]
MHVCVLCDDNWHPAHVIKEGLEPLRKHGFEFDYILATGPDFQEHAEERLQEYPVLLISKSNRVSAEEEAPWISLQMEQMLQSYVNRGGALLVIHSGTVGYKDSQVMRELVGAVFNHHPEQCPVTIKPVDEHPIAQGIHEFTIKDEHYFVDVTAGHDKDIFLSTSSEHGQQPGGWTRQQGAGCVCVLTPGHNQEVWLHPEYQKLLRQSLEWCLYNGQGRDAG